MQISEVLEVIDAAQSIAIAGHVNPDGDSIGSAFALRYMLRAMGKEAVVLLGQETKPPELYAFLPKYEYTYAHLYTEKPDLFITVDTPSPKRLGTAEFLIHEAKKVLAIDHHRNYEEFADYYLGDPTAPAAASLIWRIIQASRVEPTLNMATYCFVGIVTDTGRFAYRNTDHLTFIDAAEMVELGVNPSWVCENIYENKSVEAMQIEALVLSRLQFACDGLISYSYLYEKELNAVGLGKDATEELPSLLRSIKGVEISVLFRSQESGEVRVSLRSRKYFDVGALANRYGGGGHAGAAGCTLEMCLEEAMPMLINQLSEEHAS